MPRLAESKIGIFLGILLAVLWIASMSMADSNACTMTPILWGLAGIVGVVMICILAGYKVVRFPLTAWLGLAVGGYFLWRALTGFSVTDNWSDAGLVLGAMVFYVAGIYGGQSESLRGLVIVLTVAVFINMLAFLLLRDYGISLHGIGRTEEALIGPNSRNVSLFAYKNFASLFFALGGAMLLWCSLCRRGGVVVPIVVGISGIVVSFYCKSRAMWLVLPVATASAWILWLTLQVCSQKANWMRLVISGFVLFVLIAIVVYAFLFDPTFVEQIADIDTHGRYELWEVVNKTAYDAPLWGGGAAASTWNIAHLWGGNLPNYAHNEYLQTLVDYGLLGLFALFFLLMLHTAHGFLVLSGEHVGTGRKGKTALALLCLWTMSAAAISDYPWHCFALVAMTAYACGILASPYPRTERGLFARRWASGCRPPIRPVRALGGVWLVLTIAMGGGLLCGLYHLAHKLTPAFCAQWQFDAMVAQGASPDKQRDFLLQVADVYPHSGIADNYIFRSLKSDFDKKRFEETLHSLIQANPKQLYIATMIAQSLNQQRRFAEAEAVFRHYYPQDEPSRFWASLYAVNLIEWAIDITESTGELGKALSMLEYADNIVKKYGNRLPSYSAQKKLVWITGGSQQSAAIIKQSKIDLSILRSMELTPDHSWQQPLEPNGKPALYARLQNPKK